MAQQRLWRDGYTILKQDDASDIGRTRLKRFLYWLDSSGEDWRAPDLDAYADYLRCEADLSEFTININLSLIRQHYLAVLSNPENYDHIPPDERAEFVNAILDQIGFHTASVRYMYLVRDDDPVVSDNMQILLPESSNFQRDTYLSKFIHWLDETDRHWTQPDLLIYKQLMQSDGKSDRAIKGAMSTIRKRYQQVRRDEALLATLTDEQRTHFETNFRRLLGYLDAFPKKLSREIVEDDPYNCNWLTAQQQHELITSPDITTFTGLRDRLMLGLVLMTGIQQLEVAQIDVQHLQQRDERYGLYVIETAMKSERFIPFDDLFPLQVWLDEWLDRSEITEGAVFRGTYGNRDVLRPHSIAPETASDVLRRYPVMMNGYAVTLLFTDLRATCARRWYEAGHSLDDISRWLGIVKQESILNLLGLQIRDRYQYPRHNQ